MSKIAVIGCNGFVGSALCRYFKSNEIPFYGINRDNFVDMRGTEFDIIINSAMPSKKGIELATTPLMIFRFYDVLIRQDIYIIGIIIKLYS